MGRKVSGWLTKKQQKNAVPVMSQIAVPTRQRIRCIEVRVRYWYQGAAFSRDR